MEKAKVSLQAIAWGVSVLVGVTLLGVVPKCSEVQTIKAAREQHNAIERHLKEDISDLSHAVERHDEDERERWRELQRFLMSKLGK